MISALQCSHLYLKMKNPRLSVTSGMSRRNQHELSFVKLKVSSLAKSHAYTPLTNRVRGPYRKLRTEFFPLRFMAQARSARAINRRGKNENS